jgi:hypothetical protein
MSEMPNKPFFTPTIKTKPPRTVEAVDVAARYFVYELYDATSGHVGAWKALRLGGEVQATVARAVERGWAIVRQNGKGRTKVRSASLTDEGRRLARKSFQ